MARIISITTSKAAVADEVSCAWCGEHMAVGSRTWLHHDFPDDSFCSTQCACEYERTQAKIGDDDDEWRHR